ncbi:MAG: DUF4238 domain-containing protein [Pseudomonadota bacterium]
MKNHIVPKCLLRAWSAVSDDGRLQEFRIEQGVLRTRRTAPAGTGYQEDLFLLPRDPSAGGDRHEIENHHLRIADNDGARVLDQLRATAPDSLATNQRRALASFLKSLLVRRPEFYRKTAEEAKAVWRQESEDAQPDYEAIAVNGSPPSLAEYCELHFPGQAENQIFSSALFSVLTDPTCLRDLVDLEWGVSDFSAAKHELLLSDNPCLLVNTPRDSKFILALAISPTKALFAVKGNAIVDQLTATEPSILAQLLNRQSVANASNRIYARNKLPFRFIKNRLRELGRL